MAHYVFVRDEDGDGIYDFIQDLAIMSITDDKWRAQQFDDDDLRTIDIRYLNDHGFFAMGITNFALRIMPQNHYVPPRGGLLSLLLPPKRPRRPVPPPKPKRARPPRPMVPGIPAPRSSKPAAPRPPKPHVSSPAAPRPPRGSRPAGPRPPRPAGPGRGPGRGR